MKNIYESNSRGHYGGQPAPVGRRTTYRLGASGCNIISLRRSSDMEGGSTILELLHHSKIIFNRNFFSTGFNSCLFCYYVYFKIIPVTEDYKRQYIGCGFLVTWIYNLVASYVNIIIRVIYNKFTFSALVSLIIVAVLSLFYNIISPLAQNRALLVKYFIWQGVLIFIFTDIFNRILFRISYLL